MRQISVELINDTGLDIDPDIYVNGIKYKKSKHNNVFSIDTEDDGSAYQISIIKVDKWENRQLIYRLARMLYSLDLVWCNLLLSENLPISIHHTCDYIYDSFVLSNKLYLSELVKVNTRSILDWRKCIIIQLLEVLVILLFLTALFYLILPNSIKILSLFTFGALIVFVVIRIFRKYFSVVNSLQLFTRI